jgi:hypothetical protein
MFSLTLHTKDDTRRGYRERCEYGNISFSHILDGKCSACSAPLSAYRIFNLLVLSPEKLLYIHNSAGFVREKEKKKVASSIKQKVASSSAFILSNEPGTGFTHQRRLTPRKI